MRRDVYFNAQVAQVYGVDGAVMLHHLVYWVTYNAANGLNQHDGKTWTYNSAEAYRVFFPFWTADQIRRVLRNLEAQSAVETGNYNRMGMDRTKWYAVTEPVMSLYEVTQFGKQQTPFGDSSKSILANDQMQFGKRQDLYQVRNNSEEPVKNQVILPWDDDSFRWLWEEWRRDRKERGIKGYTARGEQAALHKLHNDSGGDVQVAMKMIQNSIANGYQGIFPVGGKGAKPSPNFNVDSLRDWATGGG